MGASNEQNFVIQNYNSPYENETSKDKNLEEHLLSIVNNEELDNIIAINDSFKNELKKKMNNKENKENKEKKENKENKENTKTRDRTNITNENKDMIINHNQNPNAHEFNKIKELSNLVENNNDEINNQDDIIISDHINDINTNHNKVKKNKKENIVKDQNRPFKLVNKKRGRGNIVNIYNPNGPDKIGNATKTLLISCVKDIHKIGKELAEKSKNFDHNRFKKLFMPTITKVTKIKDDSEENMEENIENLGIYASHDKMRELFNSQNYIVYTDYTFPKRVEGDYDFQQIEKKYERIKRKEELLKEYKEHIKDIANKKNLQDDKFIAFLNLKFVDFLKIYINYDGEKEPIKTIKNSDNISINLNRFGPKKEIDEKLRNHIKSIIDTQINKDEL